MKTLCRPTFPAALFCAAILLGTDSAWSQTNGGYEIFVSNEKSGDLTVISGADFKVTAIIPVGKRPRGVHASPDGKIVYVALSGTPIEPPPKLDANGNPIFEKGHDDDDDNAISDKAADGLGIVDVAQKKFLRKIPAGSDPEQFAVSKDGKRLYISNEDVGAATVLDADTGKTITFIPVTREPEGAGVRPDGRIFYITCETGGDIFAIDAQTFKISGHIQVHPRPRNIDFLPDGSRAFVPSESVAELNVIDSVNQVLLNVIPLPKGSRPQCVRVSADGKKVYVSNGRGGTVSVVDANTYQVLNTIPVGKRPWGIALSPDGKYLFSANGPSDDVSVIDLATEKEITRIRSPGSPWGVVAVPLSVTPGNSAGVLPDSASPLPAGQSLVSTNSFEAVRMDCIQNRRMICGKIVKITPDGLVVDSGYTNLMRAPLNRSWLIPGTVAATRATDLVETHEPDSICMGLVFVTDLPRTPGAKPKQFDYVNLEGYPVGSYTYTSVGSLERTVREFTHKLDKAAQWNFDQAQSQIAPPK